MKEFVLMFRMDITTKDAQPSKEQMNIYMQQWMAWKPHNSVIEGPYVSDNNSVAGYIIIMAKSLNDATKIAEKCPILNGENTSVEIREVGNAGE